MSLSFGNILNWKTWCVFTIWMLAACVSASVFAGDVSLGISSKEAYVGVPITVQFQFRDVSKHEPPELPSVDGLKIESGRVGTSSRSSFSFNGRTRTSESLTYRFQVTPQREGEFIIPPLTLSYDGRKELTESIRFTAVKSVNDSMVIVEISADRPSVFVGQPITLKLKLWIKPYRSEEYQVTLSEGDMWNLILEQSDWGPFADRMKELAKNRQRLGGDSVSRDTPDGDSSTYYLYEVEATIYPQRSGKIDAGQTRIVVDYPTELKMRRGRNPFKGLFEDDFFGPSSSLFDDAFSSFDDGLAITASRPIVAEANVDSIEVKPIPSQGRSKDYRGAVGSYEIKTHAKPTQVAAGDPITLYIQISGEGPLDVVQPPVLTSNETLMERFVVSDEPLGGLVDDKRHIKQFLTTIRPRSENVTEIPPIPFSFFDPENEKFVTVQSDPISIDVSPSEKLSFDNIVSQTQAMPEANESVESKKASIPLRMRPAESLLKTQTYHPLISLGLFVVVIVPPVAWVFVLLATRFGRIRSRMRHAFTPMRWAVRQIESATTCSALNDFVIDFFAEQLRLPQATKHSIVGRLRIEGCRDLANQLEYWFEHCVRSIEREDGEVLDSLRKDSIRLVEDLLSRSTFLQSSHLKTAISSANSFAKTLLLILFIGLIFSAKSNAEDASWLTPAQQKVLLNEAQVLFENGHGQTNSAESCRLVVEKYELVIQSGLRNANLYFNLGNVYQERGQYSKAIASYRRAIMLDPNDRSILTSLKRSENALSETPMLPLNSPRSVLRQISTVVFSYVSRGYALWGAAVMWIGAWTLLALRTLTVKNVHAGFVVGLFVAAIVLGSLVVSHEWTLRNPKAWIVTSNDVTLHLSDDEQSGSLGGALPHAAEVTASSVRGDWLQVSTEDGRVGWVQKKSLQSVL